VGTRDELGTRRWPRSSKKRRKLSRMSAARLGAIPIGYDPLFRKSAKIQEDRLAGRPPGGDLRDERRGHERGRRNNDGWRRGSGGS
jgi:hypothetical protein